MIKKFFKHLKIVMQHKWYVFKLCCRVGIPWRGLIHDMSKFSPAEFWESVKYCHGTRSPIPIAREKNGYSKAWLHHKGINKHHLEYWLDPRAKDYALVMPYKYAAEIACDKMAASIVYNGKNWTNNSEYEYWLKEREISTANPKIDNFLSAIFKQVTNQGINKVYTKQNFKALYKKYCIDDKTKYQLVITKEWKIREE